MGLVGDVADFIFSIFFLLFLVIMAIILAIPYAAMIIRKERREMNARKT
ncbi:MAG: hypothetical protein PHH21_00870 [Candidatus Pacebacteria bacterium]|nr:hypothetical protein [Candidatus Paceibacterota bacterium]